MQTMDKLTTDMRFTVFNICYKRILVIWIATAFTILLCLLFSGFQVASTVPLTSSSTSESLGLLGLLPLQLVNGDCGRYFLVYVIIYKRSYLAGCRTLRVRRGMACDECSCHLHLHVGEAEVEQAAGKVHVLHQLEPHEAQDPPRPRRQGAAVVP